MDDRRYAITIRNNTDAPDDPTKINPKGDDKPDPIKRTVGYIAYSKAAPYVKQALQYEIGQVSLRTGRMETQQRMQFAYDMADRAASLAISAIVAGPVGLAANVASQGISLVMKSISFETNRTQENISLGLMSGRSGSSLAFTRSNRN